MFVDSARVLEPDAPSRDNPVVEMESLSEAYNIINLAKIRTINSTPVWLKLHHACKHIEERQRALLSSIVE